MSTLKLTIFNKGSLLLIGILSFSGGSAYGRTLNPLELLNRCYAHVTGHRLPIKSPLRSQVAFGSNPIDLCLALLEKANLQEDGPNQGQMTDVTDAEAQHVLTNFYNLFRSWFSSSDLDAAINSQFSGALYGTGRFLDDTLPALYYLRALFGPNIPLSDIVTRANSLEALRSGGPIDNQTLSTANGDLRLYSQGAPVAGDLVQLGELWGVRPVESNPKRSSMVGYSVPADGRFSGPVYINQGFGGGILGDQVFMLLNWGHLEYNTADGGMIMPRRWAKNFLDNVMCRSIPVLRASDVRLYVTPPAPGRPPFRNAVTCMRCHRTTDTMASTIRNATPVLLSQDGRTGPTNRLYSMIKHPTGLPPLEETVDYDFNYFSRPPSGSFEFRTNQGALIRKPVGSVAELGKVIAGTEDLYDCAAARMLQYFTGRQTLLRDEGDPDSLANPLSADLMDNRNLVLTLGARLQKSQSLKDLIRAILESDYYKASDFH